MSEKFPLPDRVQAQITKAQEAREQSGLTGDGLGKAPDQVSEEVIHVLEGGDRETTDPITWKRENPDSLPDVRKPEKIFLDLVLETTRHKYPIETIALEVNTRPRSDNGIDSQAIPTEGNHSEESITRADNQGVKKVLGPYEIIKRYELDPFSQEALGDSIYLLSLEQRGEFFDCLVPIIIEKNLHGGTRKPNRAIANALSDFSKDVTVTTRWLKNIKQKKGYLPGFKKRAHKFAEILGINFSEEDSIANKRLLPVLKIENTDVYVSLTKCLDDLKHGVIEKKDLVKYLSELNTKDMKLFLGYLYSRILLRQGIVYEEIGISYEDELNAISSKTTLGLHELKALGYATNSQNNENILGKHIDSLLEFL